jgi:hypothetical protein
VAGLSDYLDKIQGAVSDLCDRRDEAVRVAKVALSDGDWRAALDALRRAAEYETRAVAIGRGEEPPLPRSSR